MKVLFRHLDPGASGAVSSICKLLEAYSGRFPGDRLTIMCAGESPMASLRMIENVTVELVPSGVVREIHRLVWATHLIRRQLARTSYDVVWCLNVGPYVKTVVPQVLSIHNAYQVYPSSLACHHPGSRARVAALRWFFRRSLRCADAAIVQTDLMGKYLTAIDGCPPRVAVLPKAVISSTDDAGLPLSPGLERAIRSTSATATLLYVAANTPHKNHRLLAAMMELCRSRGVAARLVVTLDAEQWAGAGGHSAESLVRSGHVIPAGWVSKDRLRQLYASADFCVMPSLLESLSSAHLEAMQWQRPQIVADLPYARDLCRDAALYADPYDAQDWVAKLELLRADSPLRDCLVSHGIARLRDFPSTWNEMAERLRSVLADVVKDARNRSAAPCLADKTEFSAA